MKKPIIIVTACVLAAVIGLGGVFLLPMLRNKETEAKNNTEQTTVASASAETKPDSPGDASAAEQSATGESGASETSMPEQASVKPTAKNKDNGWKEAYKSYLNTLDPVYSKCALVLIDGDDIPELYCGAAVSVPHNGSILCWMKNGAVQSQKIGASLFYTEKEGLVLSRTIMTGSQAAEVYHFTGGVLNKQQSGTRGLDNTAKWDGDSVSTGEYDEIVNGYLSSMTEPVTVDKSEIIRQIEKY